MKKTTFQALVFSALAYWGYGNTALAGCVLNIQVINESPHSVDVYNYIKSSVKSRGGSWRDLHRGGWGPVGKQRWSLAAGESYTDTYNSVLGCRHHREIRILYRCPQRAANQQSTQRVAYSSPRGRPGRTNYTVDLPAC